MEILYTSGDVHKAIKTIFARRHQRRIAIVAYLGENAEAFLPAPKGLKIICCPEPGATNPSAIRSLIKRGAHVQFSNDLHAKVYWSEYGCVITSANISNRALGNSKQKEVGVLINSIDFDIDKLTAEVRPSEITQEDMDRLEMGHRRIERVLGTGGRGPSETDFLKWNDSPFREPWKLGWWADDDGLEIASRAKEKSMREHNVVEPENYLNVSKSQAKAHDWLLCFRTTKKSITNFEWMFVDFVVPVDAKDNGAYEKDYPFQAIQVHKRKYYPTPPFTINTEFREAFKKATMEYGVRRIEESTSLVPPEELIRSVVKNLRKRL